GELTCSRRRLSVSVFTALALGAALLLSLSAVASARTPVRLVHNWYSYGPHDEVWQALIESFNEENADYVIEPVSGGSDDQLRTLMAAGSAPDVVDFDRFRVVDWAHQGLFMPLDRLLAGRIDVRREFLPGPVNEVVF